MIQVLSPPRRFTAGEIGRNALSHRAMIVDLDLSAWGARRLDRATTREVIAAKGADEDAGTWHKLLVPDGALDAVTKAHSRAGARHRALTLPWGENGRILSATAWFEYSQAMAEERTNCERAHREFVDAYPEHVRRAPARLGPTFCASDFPPVDMIAKRFAFRLVVLPVPHHDDFRVNLGDEIEADIRREIESTVESRHTEAQRELWTRLLKSVRHFATTMANEEKTFQRTTVSNLVDIATLAPKLSLTPDPALEAICSEILAITNACDPESLRASTKVRGRAAEDAAAALRRIEETMQGAF
jgi:hypothetical protein